MARGSSSAETGLLTRCVPEKLKHGAFYRWFLRFVRVLQFLSATIALGLFSARFYKVHRLINAAKAHRGTSHSFDAVEGILAAAALYTLLSMLVQCIVKARGPRLLRWLWVLLDLAFIGAFIAVAVLTRPHNGPAGPRHCYNNKGSNSNTNGKKPSDIFRGKTSNTRDRTCNLPWGVFILAIVSAILHAITAAFHEVRDRHRNNKSDLEERKATEQGHDPNYNSVQSNGYAHNPPSGHNPGSNVTQSNTYNPPSGHAPNSNSAPVGGYTHNSTMGHDPSYNSAPLNGHTQNLPTGHRH